MTDNPLHQGDVTKLWLTTPTYNVYREIGAVYNAAIVIPREGMPGSFSHIEDQLPSLYEFVHDTLTPFIDERFTSGVIEFDTGDQIRFEALIAWRRDGNGKLYESSRWCRWKIRATTYGGDWLDAFDVDDATLCHRAIVAYQAYRAEAKERGDE